MSIDRKENQMSEFNLIRAGKVKLTHTVDEKQRSVAEIIVNGEFHHRFSPSSRISKHLDVMQPRDLEARLTGGTFFFIGDQMVDMRDGQFDGFVHTDESVGVFMDLLGYQSKKDLPRYRGRMTEETEDDLVLRKVWSENEISVPGYAQGADFTTELSFVWNPFVKTINSSFDLVRQICTNGMVGLGSFMNTKVPLFNRQVEHLDIASRQIQNKVNGVIVDRVHTMTSERASVADCLLLEQHAFDRLVGTQDQRAGERDCLKILISAVSPKFHLHNTYRDAVFSDKNLASQLPAHLSKYDVFNIATELRSHTSQSTLSSDNALDKFSNSTLFDREDNFVASASRYTAPIVASFSSPENAFFGQMN